MRNRCCARHGEKVNNGAPCSCGMNKLSRLIEPVVLLVIRDNPGIHGYELLARMQNFNLTDSEVDAGAIYRVLRQLENREMVVSHWDTSGVGPARRLYSLTSEGRGHLAEWAELLERRRSDIGQFLESYAKAGVHARVS